MSDLNLKNSIDKIFSLNSTLDDIREGLRIKNTYCPRFFYKYRSLSKYSIENVLNNNMWFDNPINMNDPFDCRFTYDNFTKRFTITPEQYKYIYENSPEEFNNELYNFIMNNPLSLSDFFGKINIQGIPVSFLSNFFESMHEDNLQLFLNNYLKNIYFCSFSKTNHSILMWTHYTNNHSGFCIEYNTSKTHEESPFINQLYPIFYTNKLFDISEIIYNERDKIYSKKYNNLYFNYPLIYKSDEWDYEKEWRVILGNGILKHPQNINTPPISKIFFGKNFFKQFRNNISNIQKSHENISLALKLIDYCKKNNIELRLMELSSSSYSLIDIPITYDDCFKSLSKN